MIAATRSRAPRRGVLAVTFLTAALLLQACAGGGSPGSDWSACHDRVQRDARIEACTRIIDAGQESADRLSIAFMRRAISLADRQEIDLALADLGSAVALDPNNAVAFGARAGLRAHRKEFEAAVADASAAIRLKPSMATPYRTRCTAYASLSRFDDALADCRRAEALEPGAKSDNDLAWLFYMYGRNAEALTLAKRATADFPHAKTFDTLAHVELALGDVPAARRHFKRAFARADEFQSLKIEQALRDHGFSPGVVDGRLTAETEAALEACLAKRCRLHDPTGPREP